MANPLPPTIISPRHKGAAAGGSTMTFRIRHNHADPGVSTNAWSIRRRTMYPTVGAYEYWDGSAWVASTALWSGSISIAPGAESDVVAPAPWTNGTIYQYGIAVRDTASASSGYSVDQLLDVHAAPTPTITAPTGTQTVSQPTIQWAWASTAGKRQRSYQLFIYDLATYSNANFNPALPEWQVLADWKMDTPTYSPTDWTKVPVGFVMEQNITYKAYGIFTDEVAMASAYVAGPTFTRTANPATSPTVTATPQPELGVVELLLSSSNNLMSSAASDFTDATTAGWVATHNANVAYSTTKAFSGAGSLKMTASGMTFAQLDAAHASFTAEAAAYTTFSQMQQTQAAPTGVARCLSASGTAGTPVAPSTVYSAQVMVNPDVAGSTVKCGIRWYTAAGAAATTPLNQGSSTAVPANAWTQCQVLNVTSPANAAFAAIEVEVDTSAGYGDVFYVDAAVLSAGATVEWISGAGLATSYVVDRMEPDGTWVELWGAGRTAPYNQGGGNNTARIVDRDVQLNEGDVQYRVFSVTGTYPAVSYSLETLVTVTALNSTAWWIRRINDASNDAVLIASTREHREQMAGDTVLPEGGSSPVYLYGGVPNTHEYNLRARTLTKDAYDNLVTILRSKEPLVVQTNVHGDRMYGYVTDGFSDTQIRAAAQEDGQQVRMMRDVSFVLKGTARP